MPSKSESQQKLFCMAYAVRKGKLDRSKVTKAVLDIADGDMTDKQIKDFMVKECRTLKEYLSEAMIDIPYASPEVKPKEPKEDRKVFIIVKPGFLEYAQDIINEFSKNGFKLYQTKTKKLTLSEARLLYKIHKKEDFYNDLCKYMSSGLSTGITFHYGKHLKKDMAFTKVDELKDAIRENWSESDMRNVMHSSDSWEHMLEEEKIYFAI